jgi:membrane protease YdiL (CAAX protease family)
MMPHYSEKAIIERFDRPWTFFLLSAIGPWAAWIVAAWFSRQEPGNDLTLTLVSLFAGLGLILPLVFVWMLIRRDNVLVSDLWHRLAFTGKGLRYVALGAGIMLGSILLAQLISLAFGYSADQFRLAHSASFNAGILVGWVPLLLAPAIEELSWHGYGNDALRRSMNLFWTSIVFGVYWVFWHVPLGFIEGYYQANLVETGPIHTINFVVSLIPFVLLMNWLYFKSGRNIWVAIVFHLAANIFNEAFQTHPDSKVIQTGLLLMLCVGLVVKDPKFFFQRDLVDRPVQKG